MDRKRFVTPPAIISARTLARTRLPGGHPEGYLEAFAVLYREFAEALKAWKNGQADPCRRTLPGINGRRARDELHRPRHRKQPAQELD